MDDTRACPNCGSTSFLIAGRVEYVRPYDSAQGGFGYYDLRPAPLDAASAHCASCGSDATGLLRALHVLGDEAQQASATTPGA